MKSLKKKKKTTNTGSKTKPWTSYKVGELSVGLLHEARIPEGRKCKSSLQEASMIYNLRIS